MEKMIKANARRAIRRFVRRVGHVVDSVTGDILDIDQSKQEAMIKQQQEAERKAMEAAEQAKKDAAQKQQYEQDVAAEKDKIASETGTQLVSDDTGAGLSGVDIDWGTSTGTGEDKLKKMLRK